MVHSVVRINIKTYGLTYEIVMEYHDAQSVCLWIPLTVKIPYPVVVVWYGVIWVCSVSEYPVDVGDVRLPCLYSIGVCPLLYLHYLLWVIDYEFGQVLSV